MTSLPAAVSAAALSALMALPLTAAADPAAAATVAPAATATAGSTETVPAATSQTSPITATWTASGGAAGWMGPAVGDEVAGPVPGSVMRDFANATLIWSAATGVHELHGEIRSRWRALPEGTRRVLGAPTTDETGDGHARVSHFTGGGIWWTPGTGAQEVYGGIWATYRAFGAARSLLGAPTSGEQPGPVPGSRQSSFQGGVVLWSPSTGAHPVYGAIAARWRALPPGTQATLGVPTGAEAPYLFGGRISRFTGGAITWHPSFGAHELYGAIGARYLSDPAVAAQLGPATSGEQGTDFAGGRVNNFLYGAVMWTPSDGAKAAYGSIGHRYRTLTPAQRVTLGPLRTDEVGAATPGSRVSHFTGGSIYWAPTTGTAMLTGPIWSHYERTPNLPALAGVPVADPGPGATAGSVWARFSRSGHILWSAEHGPRELYGSIGARYATLTPAQRAALGNATSGEQNGGGGRVNMFTGGGIYWTLATGTHLVMGAPTANRVPDPAPPMIAEAVVERGNSWLPQYLRPINFSGDGGPAGLARITGATTISPDGKGGFYFADSGNQRIRHVNAAGLINTVVGTGQDTNTAGPHCAWGRPALQTCLNWVHGVTVDTDGGLILTDSFNQVVTKVGSDGIVRRLAGNGVRCEREKSACGEGGPALSAQLDRPTTARRIGNTLYISDSANRILTVGPDGVLRRVVGTGEAGFSGDEGPATAAKIWAPADMVAYKGGLLVSDGNNCKLRWVDPAGVIHAFAGYGTDLDWCWRNYGNPKKIGATDKRWAIDGPMTGDVGDGGSAVWSRVSVTGFLTVVGDDVYVADFLNYRVRRISDGRIFTVAGGILPANATPGPVVSTKYPMGWVSATAYDPVGKRLLFSDGRISQATVAN